MGAAQEICPKQANSEALHCWHHTGVSYLTNPPRHEEICCYCGALAMRRERSPNLDEHGPWIPGLSPKKGGAA